MIKIIAIPTENGLLCTHFGHCQKFYFAEIRDGKIVKEESITPPEHQPGVYPAWVKQQGASLVIAAGIGAKAKELFAKQNISVYTNTATDSNTTTATNEPRKLVDLYIQGRLSILVDTCTHDHSENSCSQ